MKNILIINLFIFSSFQVNSIKKLDPDIIILDGYCYEILNSLKKETTNDSLIVSYFCKKYILTISIPKHLKRKKPNEFIEYYFLEENKHIRCFYKEYYYKNVLLNK